MCAFAPRALSLQTVLMEWTRAKDWLIGATGMLLTLGVAVFILWWVVSNPASGEEPEPTASPTVTPDRPTAAGPPGDLSGDDLWFADLTLDAGTVVTPESVLRDVRAVGHDIVTGPDGLVIGRLAVDATVPFDAVAKELGNGSVVRAADGGQATVVRTVEALGRELRVTATGTVEVEAGKLVVEPSSIDFGGPAFLSEATAAVVRELVTIEHEVAGLPEGLTLHDVSVQGDGFRVNFRGEDVKLVP